MNEYRKKVIKYALHRHPKKDVRNYLIREVLKDCLRMCLRMSLGVTALLLGVFAASALWTYVIVPKWHLLLAGMLLSIVADCAARVRAMRRRWRESIEEMAAAEVDGPQ